MKMAKASQADLDMAIELSNALEALADRWGATMPEKVAKPTGDEEVERFELSDHDHCIRVIEYLQRLTRSASLFRVVFGMLVLLDPCNEIVDPEADTLEHHPKVEATRLAWEAACAFIDAHAADPDLTPKMRAAHAEFVRCRDALKAITNPPSAQPAAPAEVTP